MTLHHLTAWAAAHPELAAASVGACLLTLTVAVALTVRRAGGPVFTAALGALVCTVYTADTSWRFAEHHLGMVDRSERVIMFAAGEVALLACAVMARANKRATATDDTAGTPGVPGVLVWCITSVQIIPAFTESGLWGGLVRAVFGPVMAGLLWHLAMGLEIRITRPEALSTGLPAQIAHELRERLLSYLGLATRNRTAEQISRDRASARTVRLASRRRLGPWGKARLAAAVTRSRAAVDSDRRHTLMQDLAGRRSADELRTVPVTSPWVPQPVPEPYPPTPLGVTGAELRRLHPLDAVARIDAAHPGRTPAEVAALCTEYGVPVSETQVRVALRAGNPAPQHPQPDEAPAVPAAPTPRPADAPVPVPAVPVPGLHLDVVTEPQVRHEFACAVPAQAARPARTRAEVRVRVPDSPAGLEHPLDFIRRRAAEERQDHPEPGRTRTRQHPVPGVPAVPGAASTAGTDPLLARAREVDATHLRTRGRPAGIQTLKTELRIGQTRAQALRASLNGSTT
ncbi:hypothetical protein AB0I84_05970 [Streptomyces spectabilis]|uniref:hypothetical protein n=1 Tax=Streptomyces spectabilis TaxID=68270 RepID=UPI0033FF1796